MIFTEIVQMVMDRLNLASNDARDRVGRYVNDRNRRVVSSIGLPSSNRVTFDMSLNSTTNVNLPEVQINGITKVVKLQRNHDTGEGTGVTVLKELTFDALTSMPFGNGLPRAWALKRAGASKVTIILDSFPAAQSFSLNVEGVERTDVLADSDEPVWPENFHDILVEGAMSEELRKMEKPQLATLAEQKYEARLSDLRMFMAKSAYLDIYQGKDKPSYLWWRPWFSRVFTWE